MAMAITIGRGGGGGGGELLGLSFNPNHNDHRPPHRHRSLFFSFLSSPRQSLLLFCPRQVITNECALSSSSASLTCTALLPPPPRGPPRMDMTMTRKEALWINNGEREPSAFSALQGSGRAGRLVRMEQLWQEFF